MIKPTLEVRYISDGPPDGWFKVLWVLLMLALLSPVWIPILFVVLGVYK